MKKIKIMFASLAAVLCASQAQADFMIEPFLGYEMGDYGSNNKDVKGTNMGLRLGGTTAIVSYGLEYSIGALEADTSPKTDVDTTDIGAFVSVEFPILVRAFGTYFVKSDAEINNADYEGSGMRLGVGYTGLPFVSINLEKIHRNYDEGPNGVKADIDVDTYMLSASVPLP
jgi:hypothetical protein